VAGWRKRDAEFVETVREFIDARNHVKHALVNAPNPIRAEIGGKMIGNVGLLVSELEKAPEDQRSKIHDHISLYLLDLRRLFELMAMGRGRSLNEYLRSELGPGDRVLIVRGGGKAKKMAAGG
jgi:hypothetical protein